MKIALYILAVVLANIVFIIISVYFHFNFTYDIMIISFNSENIASLILIVFSITGILTYSYLISHDKWIKNYGIGLIAMAISLILFAIFFINKSITFGGEYKAFKLYEDYIGTNNFIRTNFDERITYTEVSPEKNIKVDSVNMKVKTGLFGIGVLTEDVKIVESSNCDHEKIDSANLSQSHMNIGHELSKQRCFRGAIDHYSVCIEKDSSEALCYYNRGLIFLVKENYKNALKDFISAAQIEYRQSDKKTIEFLESPNITSNTDEFLERIKEKNINELTTYVQNIHTLGRFVKYQEKIELCLEKVNGK